MSNAQATKFKKVQMPRGICPGGELTVYIDWCISDEGESDEEEEAVPFKCIGPAHEKNYQHHLEN